MTTSAVKYPFVSRNESGIPSEDVIAFWQDEPTLSKYGEWESVNGSSGTEDADLWVLMTGMEFEPGTCIKNVQNNVNWEKLEE